MKVSPISVKVSDVLYGFEDKGEGGVFAYGGKLTIRPPYQREFVYDLKQSEAVIQTVLQGFPLNVMYWAKNSDTEFEVLDGQQRTLSLMYFLSHKFQITYDRKKFYHDSLPSNLLDTINNYELMVYICESDNELEKLKWFETVNIAGEKLTDQELRNSVYTGAWLSDAKRYFSKNGCVAKKISDRYITGTPINQELLEKALKGICENQGLNDITEYMSKHRNDHDADELWQYFQDVINWTQKTFSNYYVKMKGRDWCHLYNMYSGNRYNSSVIAKETETLMNDEEVQRKEGIFEYLLSKDSNPFAGKLLNLRTFTERDKRNSYKKQKGICPICKKKFQFEDMQADHIKPWSKGGLTIPENCQMLCKDCNAKKSDMY